MVLRQFADGFFQQRPGLLTVFTFPFGIEAGGAQLFAERRHHGLVEGQAIVAKNINAAAISERADVAKLNANLQQELAAKGLTFNQHTVAPFREKLRAAGFYAEWKGKYGEQAWALLEKSVGKLS